MKINKELCIGCGACVSICSEGFEMSDGKAVVKKDDESCINEAKENCPVNAIE